MLQLRARDSWALVRATLSKAQFPYPARHPHGDPQSVRLFPSLDRDAVVHFVESARFDRPVQLRVSHLYALTLFAPIRWETRFEANDPRHQQSFQMIRQGKFLLVASRHMTIIAVMY
jgi:hypothetical protein